LDQGPRSRERGLLVTPEPVPAWVRFDPRAVAQWLSTHARGDREVA
jgi:hypothetical protein